MNDGTDTLRARLNKHAAEMTALEVRHKLELEAAIRIEEDRRYKEVRYWKGLAIAGAVLAMLAISLGWYIKLSAPPPSTWHTDAPPADQRIQMVVYVYKGADGIWKSYAEGHPVEPVTSATGQMLWHP